jgi:RNA polymerase sigma-70 factor, ECF subfamily
LTPDLDRLAARASKGDRAAFRAIVVHTEDRLFRLAARMMGSAADAEDVLQEAYLKAYRALESSAFDGRSRIETWLYRIVTHAAIDALRSRKRREADPPPADTTTEGAEAAAALAEIGAWLSELPAAERAAIVLRVVEGLSTAQAAAALGCSEEAVEQRLVRARVALRKRRDFDER